MISLKSNFQKRTLCNDGLFSRSKPCVIQKQKNYDQNRDKSMNYYLASHDRIEKYHNNREEERKIYEKQTKKNRFVF